MTRGTRIHFHSENTHLGRTLDFEFVTDLAVDEQAAVYEITYARLFATPVTRESDGFATRVYAGIPGDDYAEVVLWPVYLHRHPTQAARAKRDALPVCDQSYTTEEVYDEVHVRGY